MGARNIDRTGKLDVSDGCADEDGVLAVFNLKVVGIYIEIAECLNP